MFSQYQQFICAYMSQQFIPANIRAHTCVLLSFETDYLRMSASCSLIGFFPNLQYTLICLDTGGWILIGYTAQITFSTAAWTQHTSTHSHSAISMCVSVCLSVFVCCVCDAVHALWLFQCCWLLFCFFFPFKLKLKSFTTFKLLTTRNNLPNNVGTAGTVNTFSLL